jgi:hypothetical protein
MITDDTSVIISGTDLGNLCIKTKRVLCHLSELFAAKILDLNLYQTSQNFRQIVTSTKHWTQ